MQVGGDTAEASGRSSRWNKVAWLRREFYKAEWLIWMDLDAFFTEPKANIMELLDQSKDLHVTYDFQASIKVHHVPQVLQVYPEPPH